MIKKVLVNLQIRKNKRKKEERKQNLLINTWMMYVIIIKQKEKIQNVMVKSLVRNEKRTQKKIKQKMHKSNNAK